MRLVLMLVLLAAAPLSVLALPQSQTVAVIGPPWVEADGMIAIVAEAGGLPLRDGARANVMIAQSLEPHFVRRLYQAGAWLVLSSSAGSPCAPSSSQAQI